MRIILCLEFEGVDCNGDRGTDLVNILTEDCERIKEDYQASDCYVMEADDNDLPPDRDSWTDDNEDDNEDDREDDVWYRVERFYGDVLGWDKYYYDSGELFDTREEALERYWEAELEEGADLADLVLPEDIRIVRISNAS